MKPFSFRTFCASLGEQTIILRMPKSEVSASERARMLMLASLRTRVTSERRPALFSRKTEICSVFMLYSLC